LEENALAIEADGGAAGQEALDEEWRRGGRAEKLAQDIHGVGEIIVGKWRHGAIGAPVGGVGFLQSRGEADPVEQVVIGEGAGPEVLAEGGGAAVGDGANVGAEGELPRGGGVMKGDVLGERLRREESRAGGAGERGEGGGRLVSSGKNKLAEGDEGNIGKLEAGGRVRHGRAVWPAVPLGGRLSGKKEGRSETGLIERLGDEDMEEAVAPAAGEGKGGVEEGAHGFAAAGEEAEDAGIRVGGKAADGGEDGLGGGGVIERGPDVIKRSGRTAEWIAHPDDDGRLERKAVGARLGRAEQSASECLPNCLGGVSREWCEQLVEEGARSLSGGDDDDGVGNERRAFLGERPNCFGKDGGSCAEDRDEDGAGGGGGAGWMRT